MVIDYNKLEEALDTMGPSSQLYKLVKAEMLKRGRWKNAPRGKAFNIGKDTRRKPL